MEKGLLFAPEFLEAIMERGVEWMEDDESGILLDSDEQFVIEQIRKIWAKL